MISVEKLRSFGESILTLVKELEVAGLPILGVPKHWPPHHNANTAPCDMIQGPCACGAYHFLDDDWVITGLSTYGIRPKEVKCWKCKQTFSTYLGLNLHQTNSRRCRVKPANRKRRSG